MNKLLSMAPFIAEILAIYPVTTLLELLNILLLKKINNQQL